MQSLTDIQKSTLSSLKGCCEKLGFDQIGSTNSDGNAEYSQPDFAQGSDIINLLNTLHGIEEENLDTVEEDPTVSVLKECMQKIALLEERRAQFEQVIFKLTLLHIFVLEPKRTGR
jgi:hypothetical protein